MNSQTCSRLWVLGLLALMSATVVTATPSDPVRNSATFQSLMRKSDSLFAARRYTDALAILENANKTYPSEADVLWRLANVMINAGDVAEDEAMDRYYNRSVDYATRAVAADPRCANAHAYLAAALGAHAVFAGGKEKVKLSTRIRDELDRALALDPDNQLAHSIYGSWHRAVSEVSWIERQLANAFLGGLPDGSLAESVRHLREAMRLSPQLLRNHYELGLTYIAMDKPSLAAASFRTALKCPTMWSTDARRKKEMREYIEEQG
ncbi:MAG: tetratricopeptide repeat protein [Ignavibacteria bacterium]|nr:tetratricopeptide repeat protein [Ignavibacteria bacterium]